MKRNRILIVIGVFVFSVLLEVWLERNHKVDSIGLWYTVLSAALYTIPISFVAIYLFEIVWPPRR